MVLFHFRVHTDNLDFEDLIKFIKSHSVTTLIVKELGDRPHIHSIISPIKTVSTFRQQFLKAFPMCKGNKCYSLEEVKDEIKMKNYLCKGNSKTEKPDVVHNNDVDIDLHHNQYWQINQELRTQTDGTVKKQKALSWSEQVRDDFEKENPLDVSRLATPIAIVWKPSDSEVESYRESQQKLFSFIISRLGKSAKKLNKTILEDLYRGIANSYVQSGPNSDKYNRYLRLQLDLD